MNKFLERLQSGEILIADGSTGASLQKMGLKPGIPPEDLVFDAPEMVLQLEGAFVAAGSDIILTDTFGGTRLRMKESKYVERAPEVNTARRRTGPPGRFQRGRVSWWPVRSDRPAC